ncbi:hypothetical protein J7K03_02515 [bacterium]|nr:hypothetical protein [bacterium]
MPLVNVGIATSTKDDLPEVGTYKASEPKGGAFTISMMGISNRFISEAR